MDSLHGNGIITLWMMAAQPYAARHFLHRMAVIFWPLLAVYAAKVQNRAAQRIWRTAQYRARGRKGAHRMTVHQKAWSRERYMKVRNMSEAGHPAAVYGYAAKACYYLVIVFLIWAEYRLLNYAPYSSGLAPDALYFIFTAIFAAECIPSGEDTGSTPSGQIAMHASARQSAERAPSAQRGKRILAKCLLPVLAVAGTVLVQERTAQIAESLQNPVTSIQGVPAQVNWLGHRLALMADVWRGALSPVEDPLVENILRDCPLYRIYHTHGVAALLLTAALVTAELLFLRHMLRVEQKTLKRPLVLAFGFSLLLRGAMGLVLDAMLVNYTEVGIWLLKNPYDVIPWIWFLAETGPWINRQAVGSADRFETSARKSG